MSGLTDAERARLDRFVDLAAERLGERLARVVLFGSAVRRDGIVLRG
jgi:predicted nucleotidyltransferase